MVFDYQWLCYNMVLKKFQFADAFTLPKALFKFMGSICERHNVNLQPYELLSMSYMLVSVMWESFVIDIRQC